MSENSLSIERQKLWIVLILILFIVFIAVANRFINACRMYRRNEKLSATEEGQRLLEIREYKELYEALLFIPCEEECVKEENE